MSRESFISMMQIILHSICITADLVNLEDMLQNGTVISETMIEKSAQLFYCMQYCNTGRSHRLQAPSMADRVFHSAHLAPFVDDEP